MKRVTLVISMLLCFSASQVMGAQWQTTHRAGMEVHLYVPDTPPKLADKRALMISLHGCAQSNEDLRDLGNWESTADNYGMVVALPDVPPSESKIAGCWDYYETGHTRRNRSNDNLIDLAKILTADPSLGIDKNQVYVSGLSSGGGQTGVIGCLAPDIFAGLGINAGPTIGTGSHQIGFVATTESAAVNLCKRFAGDNQPFFETQITSVIYGDKDFLVAQGYGRLNAEMLATLYQADTKSGFDVSELDGHEPAGAGTLWLDDKGPRVSLIEASGLDHAWPAGSGPGGTQCYVRASGVNYPAYLADFFFANNRRVSRNQAPVAEITEGRQSGSDIIVRGTVTDPDPGDSIASLRIKFVDICQETNVLIPEKDVDALENGSFSHNAGWPKDHSFYKPMIVATDSQGASATVEGSPVKVGDPPSITVDVTISGQCVHLSGTSVQGAKELAGVQVKVDAGSFESANGVLNWNYEECGFPPGKHTVIAKVADIAGSSDCRTMVVDIAPTHVEESGTIMDHINRYAIYPNENYPDAPSNGWGLCDRTFVELNSELGTSGLLTIYGTEDGRVWCADSQNLPVIGQRSDQACKEFSTTLATHVSSGRAYSKGWWLFKAYYAMGTDIQLTGSADSTVILHEKVDETGKFYPGGCN